MASIRRGLMVTVTSFSAASYGKMRRRGQQRRSRPSGSTTSGIDRQSAVPLDVVRPL